MSFNEAVGSSGAQTADSLSYMGVASSRCHVYHTADRATVLDGGVSWEKAGTDSSLFIYFKPLEMLQK
jgi:hypothetical protein